MLPVLIGIGAFVSWVGVCALSAFLVTIFSVVGGKKLEYYLVITDRWTFALWIAGLMMCPGIAFIGNWVVWGAFLSEQHYGVVRLAWLTGGISLAVAALVFMFFPGRDREEGSGELVTLVGGLLVDLSFCFMLAFYFTRVANFMRGFR